MLVRLLTSAFVGVVLLTACGGDDEEQTTETTSAPAETTTTTTEPEAEAASRCEEVPADMLDAIASGLTLDGEGTLRSGAAVRSDDFEKLYFIAAEVDAPGLEAEGDVAVWASNSLQPGGGMILAVDGLAKEFSEWPAGDSTDANITSTDDGVSEARSCVG